jgi:ERCC4-type nuclease
VLRTARRWTGICHATLVGSHLDEGMLSRNGVRGVLVALADRGIPVLRSVDPKDSAMWLRSLAAARSAAKRVDVQPPYRRPIGARDPTAVAMLSVVPGVSLPTARRVVDAFGTVRDMANASPEELMAVPGVGPRRSQAIHEALTQPAYRIPRQRNPGRAT